MRALVTGGAGFIGSHVVEDLRRAGYEVAVVDDLSTGRRDNLPADVELAQLDIRDGAALDAAVARLRPALISHHAAQTSVSVSVRAPVDDAMTNVIGTVNVLEAARRHGVERIVFASTGGAIYGEVPEGERGRVGRAPRPFSGYACAKLAAESYLDYYHRAHGLAAAVLRYANVYGPRQDPHGEAGVVAIFVDRLRAGQPLQINARQRAGDDGCIRDYVFVGDVVAAHRLATTGALDGQILDVGTGVGTTTRTLALTLAEVMDARAELHDAPPRPGDVERSVLDPSAFERAVGPALDLREGLRRTVG
ncbi:MAG: NAD-dependent epimerase/dehydratase family protein [Myxococcales bacterium]|nr:NAD-dependent epimerase/dehydratase family protein [Myxococcales bacterium]